MARPSSYTPELAQEICGRLAEGETIRKICRDPDMPAWATVWRWLQASEEFRAQYAQAREAQAHFIAEQAVEDAEIAEDAAKGRLAFDARRWFAGKIAPKVYGEKQTTLLGQDEGSAPVTIQIVRFSDPASE